MLKFNCNTFLRHLYQTNLQSWPLTYVNVWHEILQHERNPFRQGEWLRFMACVRCKCKGCTFSVRPSCALHQVKYIAFNDSGDPTVMMTSRHVLVNEQQSHGWCQGQLQLKFNHRSAVSDSNETQNMHNRLNGDKLPYRLINCFLT